jgi:hypothetical protein
MFGFFSLDAILSNFVGLKWKTKASWNTEIQQASKMSYSESKLIKTERVTGRNTRLSLAHKTIK